MSFWDSEITTGNRKSFWDNDISTVVPALSSKDLSTSGSTPQTAQISGSGFFPVDFAKDIAQGFARGTAAGGATIAGIPRQISQVFKGQPAPLGSYTPSSTLEKTIYGTDGPISLSSEGSIPKIAPEGSPQATFVGAGFTIADLLGGSEGKSVLRALLGAKDVAEILKVGRQLGVAEDMLGDFGKTISDIKLASSGKQVESDIKSYLDSLSRLQSTTRTTQVARPLESLATRATESRLLPASLPRLAEEAASPTISPEVFSLARTVSDVDEIVKKVTDALKVAPSLNKEQEALYATERAQRTAKLAGVQARSQGEQGFFSQLGTLKGELPKVQFESIRGALTQPDIDTLFSLIQKSPKLLPFEKVSAQSGLAKLLGAEGGSVPVKSEVSLLNEVFPPEFIRAVMDKRPLMQRLAQMAGDVLNVPRSLMASFDLSAPLRQGVFFLGRPKQFAPAFGQMFKMFGSEKAYQAIINEIQSRPTYRLMREAGLAITDASSPVLTAREERFMSNLAEKIPGIGVVIRASDRAYTGFLNKLRADVFDDLYTKSRTLAVNSPEMNHSIARFVNAATGRGDLGMFNRAAVILNATFFSPRLMASRLNLLNPVFYYNLPPFVRKEALKSLFMFSSIGGTVLGLSALAGAEVELDPRSADFGKPKYGNTRYDIWGGFQQYIRLASQLTTGKIISSTSGREITLGEGYKPLTRKDILLRFFESKESPILSFVTSLFTGQDTLGRDINIPTEVVNRLIPLGVQDMYDLYQDKGLEGLLWWLPAPFGVGTQSYGKVQLETGPNPIGQETAAIQPVPGLGEQITNKLFGPQSVGSSKGFDVEQYYDQLLQMNPDDAKTTLKQIATVNPELVKDILQVKKDRDKGITAHDKDLKGKGVASGDRALAIIEDLKSFETDEEKKNYLKELSKKGVLTEPVLEQVTQLLKMPENREQPVWMRALNGLKDFMQSLAPKTVGEAKAQGLVPLGVNIFTDKNGNALPDDTPIPEGTQFIDPTGAVGSLERVGGKVAAKAAPAVFTGLKNLTTSLIEKLKGRSTVSKQFIQDLTNSADMRQAEKDLIRNVLEDQPKDVNVKDFADRVQMGLLPLDVAKPVSSRLDGSIPNVTTARYENITLPDDLRGPVASYGERVYTSPIKTSAGNVHYGGLDGGGNYFAHTRIEDLPDSISAINQAGTNNKGLESITESQYNSLPRQGGTRRVIEIQADLFQKGRLEEMYKAGEISKADYERLLPFRNAWFERIIREEVKQAAKDGKTKLQFPTGETAMKIEGLGQGNDRWSLYYGNDARGLEGTYAGILEPRDLKVGAEVADYADDHWIITDVLGDGKFKAVPKAYFDLNAKNWKYSIDNSMVPDGGNPAWMAENTVTGQRDFVQFTPENKQKALEHLKSKVDDKTPEQLSERYGETFDISGKVDTSNPIYKFYNKDVARFLTNKFGAKEITDPQGVKWMEINVPKSAAKEPVQAFGKAQIGALLGGAGAATAGAAGFAAGTTPSTVNAQNQAPQQNFDTDTIRQGILYAENSSVIASGKDPYKVVGVTGDLGKYQLNPTSLKEWSKAWLGKTYTNKEFLNDPQAQEKFFDEFLAVVKRLNLTNEEAAVAWHKGWGELGTGDRATRDQRFKDKLATLMSDPATKKYLDRFNEGLRAAQFEPAIPRDDKERAFIESAKKQGYFVSRDPNGDLNARPNFAPGWNEQRSWDRTHSGEGLI